MEKLPSLTELRDICYPKQSQRHDPYRKIGVYLLKPALLTPLTPNHITTIRIFFLVLGFFFFVSKEYTNPLLGVLIFQFCILLDTIDGAVARYKKLSSTLGEYYDFIVDHTASTLIYFLAFGLFILHSYTSPLPILLLDIILIFLANLCFFIRTLYTVDNISKKELEHRFLFRLFYQDNGRLIVNTLLIGVLISFYQPLYDLLILLFIAFMIFKVLYLVFLFWSIRKKFLFSPLLISKAFSLIFNSIKNLRKV